MDEIRIEPCPKCGDAWIYVSDGDYYSGYEEHGFRVNCKCGFAWKTMPFYSTRKETIIKWNEYVIALNTAKDAFEKQIPKKVNVIFSLKTHKPICFKCPTCDSSVIGSGFYCWNCGQHLDWMVENDE